MKIQYPVISADAAERFNRFAEQASVQFHLGHPAPRPDQPPGQATRRGQSPDAVGVVPGDNDGARGLSGVSPLLQDFS